MALLAGFTELSFSKDRPNICDILKYLDEEKAEEIIETKYETIAKLPKKHAKQLSGFQDNVDNKVIAVGVAIAGEPPFSRLCEIDDKGEQQELLLRVQGCVIKATLPPIRKQVQIGNAVRYSQQAIDIVGYGSPSFATACSNLEKIYELVSNQSDFNLDPYKANTYRGFPVVTASNRYFTEEKYAPHEVLSNKPQTIDPMRLLAKAAATCSTRLVSLPENDVEYYNTIVVDKTDGTSKLQRVVCHPDMIGIGDFVELGLSIVFFPSGKKANRKMTLVLRSITLLSNSLRLAANELARQQLMMTTPMRLKRKIRTYDSDEEEESVKRGASGPYNMELEKQGNRIENMSLGTGSG